MLSCMLLVLSCLACTGMVLAADTTDATKDPDNADDPTSKPVVRLATTFGDITIELWPDKAPETVSNFVAYVQDGFFDGLIFHRVIDRFMIQGGGFDERMNMKPTKAPIKNEASAEAPNKRGTIAMARTADPNSATSQFFINLVDNHPLNFKNPSPQGIGYCAFGTVTEGMDVVDRIAKTHTQSIPPHDDVPTPPIVIQSASVVSAP